MSDIHTTQLAKFLAMRDADGLANYLSHGSNTVMSESKQTETVMSESKQTETVMSELKQTETTQIDSCEKINHDCENRALFEACRDGVYDISEVLVQFGADVHHNSADIDHSAPLYIACENSHPNIVKLLLRRGGSAPAISLMYALMAAMGKSDSVSETFTDDRLICANALVDAGARLDFAVGYCSPLMLASGNYRLAEFALNNGADVNWRSPMRTCALHWACDVYGGGKEDVVELLLNHGADIDAADQNGRTALHRACVHPYLIVAQLLLDHGADMHYRLKSGRNLAQQLVHEHQMSHHARVAVLRLLALYEQRHFESSSADWIRLARHENLL